MRKIVLWLFLVFVLETPAFSEPPDNMFQKGTWELGVGLNAGFLSLEPVIGYFLLDNLETIVNADISQSHSRSSPGPEVRGINTGSAISGEIAYHFPTGTFVVPIVGAGARYKYFYGHVNGSPEDKGHSFDAVGLAGLRLEVRHHASVNLISSYEYQKVNFQSGAGYSNSIRFQLSYSLFF